MTSLWARLRSLLRIGKKSDAGGGSQSDPEDKKSEEGGQAKKEEGSGAQAPEPTLPPDPFETQKEGLRKLTTWIVATAGSVAATLVVGSQLSDLGSLDADAKATMFGLEGTRFGFAAGGLAIALACTAFVLAAAVWVQTSSTVTVKELLSFPPSLGKQVLGRRVKAKVRETIEADLDARLGVSLEELVASRRDARQREWGLRKSLMSFSDRTAMLNIASAGTRPPVFDEGDWLSAEKIVAVAQGIADAQTLQEVPPAREKALGLLGKEAVNAYENAQRDADTWDRMLMLVLDAASYLRMRLTFGMMLKYIVAATFVGGLAIATFAWAIHPPDEPTTGNVTVRVISLDDLGELVTSGCDPSSAKIEVVPEAEVAVVSATSKADGSDCAVVEPQP